MNKIIMNEENTIHKANITPLKSISIIWLVPFIALLIGAWIIYSQISNQGTLMTIHFQSGKGIEAGKTKIRTKSVDVGIVEDVALNHNNEGVIVTARINKKNKYLLKQDTQLWVVRPRIGKSGISGIGTILSGAYIELAVGSSTKEQYEFTGLENIPVTMAGIPGLHITLDSNGDRAQEVGDPILFRGIEVGRVEYVYFNANEKTVYYDVFIESPYDQLITENTKFWEINGVEIDLSANGVRVQTGTIESIISGGVTFDVPENTPKGKVVTKREFFSIYPNKEAIYENKYKQYLQFILLFKDSIRGLKPNAPVEFKGIKIGSVIRTDVNYVEITNILNKNTLIPVLIKIEPARLGFGYADHEEVLPVVEKEIITSLKNGLRGSLATGNLLTGSKYIKLQYKEPILHDLQYYSGHLIIPTLEGQFDQILTQASKVMDKLYLLPIESVLKSADTTLNQITNTVKEFEKTTEPLEAILNQASQQKLVKDIQDTLKSFKTLASNFSEGSLTHSGLRGIMTEMKGVLSRLKPLLVELSQKPDSLIFSEEKGVDIEPQGVR